MSLDVSATITPRPTNVSTGGWFRDLALLAVLSAILFGATLGQRSLWEPDEGRYAEIPREMLVTGDYVTPRLDGVKYFEKPPLMYWLTAASIRVFGYSQTAVRLWPALFAVFGCLAAYVAGRSLYDRKTGLLAAAVLATSLLYFFLAEILILDMAVSVLLSTALFAFLLGVRLPGRAGRRYLMVFYVAAALALLTKGLVGIVIPGLVIGMWMLVTNNWSTILRMRLPLGLLVFLVISAPWHILVSMTNPEFPYFYFIHEHFLRYATMEAGRYQPVWFFLPILALGLFPWVGFVPQSIRFALPRSWSRRDGAQTEIFLLIWAVAITLFYSFSKSKLIPYILPVLPPLALLLGHWLANVWDQAQIRRLKPGLYALLSISLVLAALLVLLPTGIIKGASTQTAVAGLGNYLYLIAGALVLLGLVPVLFMRRGTVPGVITATIVCMALFLSISSLSLKGLDPQRSVKPIAQILKQQLRPQDRVVAFHTYPQALPYYLRRRITIAGWRGELQFGAKHQDTRHILIDDAELIKLWNSATHVYVVMRSDASNESELKQLVHDRYRRIARIGRYTLATNWGAAP